MTGRQPTDSPSGRVVASGRASSAGCRSAVDEPIETVSLFVRQGRWWCEKCGVRWQGSHQVPDIAPHVAVGEDGKEWAPIHDCGTVMIRTEGDELADG